MKRNSVRAKAGKALWIGGCMLSLGVLGLLAVGIITMGGAQFVPLLLPIISIGLCFVGLVTIVATVLVEEFLYAWGFCDPGRIE